MISCVPKFDCYFYLDELIKLKKENQQLKMENDILKQVALIMEYVGVFYIPLDHRFRGIFIRGIYCVRENILYTYLTMKY